MFSIAVGVLMGGYWLFHYGYYFAKGAPISLLDDILPSRRPTFLAAIDYMRQQGPFSLTPGAQSTSSPPPAQTGTSATNTNTGPSKAPPQIQQPLSSGGVK